MEGTGRRCCMLCRLPSRHTNHVGVVIDILHTGAATIRTRTRTSTSTSTRTTCDTRPAAQGKQ